MAYLKKFSSEFWSYDKKLEDARRIHFKRLNGVTYLDHAGSTQYSECQLSNLFADLSSSVFGNPHSRSPSSMHSSDIIEDVRNKVLHHFNVTSAEYAVIFTSNCTTALKIVGESFDFEGQHETQTKCISSDREVLEPFEGHQPVFLYLNDNHTSVIGMRELFKSRKVSFQCMTADEVESSLSSSCKIESNDNLTNIHKQNVSFSNLFAFPAQSNFSGKRYPLSWVQKIQGQTMFAGHHGKWHILLDAASYLTTSNLDLNLFQPDFVVLSFYKIFGYPTGLGALLLKRTSGSHLVKTYFGGGTVEASLASEDFHVKRKDISQRFEDGTLPFLEILALKHGFDSLHQVTGSVSAISSHAFALAKYVHDQLVSWRYNSGRPLVVMYHNTDFTCETDQGPIVNFNLLSSDGHFVGFAQVEKLAQLYNIHFRTGCFCNMGACENLLNLTADQVKENMQHGHVCGDDIDLINGYPTGSIRISFGYCSTFHDAEVFLRFINECFLNVEVEEDCSKIKLHDERVTAETINHSEGNHKEPMHLVGIYIYPVKSCGAFAVTERKVSHRGLLNDREWMIVNEHGVCISQKREPQLCCIQPSVDAENKFLTLSYSGFESIHVPITVAPFDTPAQLCSSKVCGDKISGNDCGEEVALWLQSVLDKPKLRLVQQNINDERITSRKSSGVASGKLSLANESQYLLVGTASLVLLLSRMKQRVETGDISKDESCSDFEELLERFRPNLVVETSEAFEEENWPALKIGTELFLNEGPCSRCQMICVDQKTGRRTKEPLLSLVTIPLRKTMFGILLRRFDASFESCLSVGDSVSPVFEIFST